MKGKNVNFRKVKKEDLKLIRDWRNSPGIWEYNTQYTLLNMPQQDFWYKKILEINSDRIMFMIESKKGLPIGICGLIHIDFEQKNAEVAIILGDKRIQGKGYGSEVLQLLLKYGFQKLKLHRISAEIFEFNKISVKLFSKLNFRYELTFHNRLWRRGRWWNVQLYSILSKEFSF